MSKKFKNCVKTSARMVSYRTQLSFCSAQCCTCPAIASSLIPNKTYRHTCIFCLTLAALTQYSFPSNIRCLSHLARLRTFLCHRPLVPRHMLWWLSGCKVDIYIYIHTTTSRAKFLARPAGKTLIWLNSSFHGPFEDFGTIK
jgi:hypothetical protein